jgi:tetratricopeptide (TPR) repeat protein
MNALAGNRGKLRLGLVGFCLLLALVVGTFVYQYADKANRLNDEAVELINRKNFDKALQKLDEAIAEASDRPVLHYHRGLCLAKTNRFEESLAAFERAVQLDPKAADAHYGKGEVLKRLKRYKEAVAALERALEMEKELKKANRANAWFSLGESLFVLHARKLAESPEEAGTPTRAITAYKNYIQLSIGGKERRIAEKKIRALQSPEEFKEDIEQFVKDGEEEADKTTITLEELREQVEKQ